MAAVGYLPNVESSQPTVLGSISVEGDGLLANIDLTPSVQPDAQRIPLVPETVVPGASLPELLMQQLEKSTLPVPSP